MTAITLLMAIALIVLAGAGITAWARNARKTGANAPGALAGAAVAIAAAGTLAIAPAMPAFAADESHHADDGHAWSTDEIAVDDASGMLGDDIVWFGQSKLFTKTAAPNDILAAGQSIAVSSCTVSGSIRAAAEDIAVRGADVAHSITLAAKDATVSDTTAQAVAIAAGDASFSGECDALYICAEHAVIDGTVHGDVVVNADSVRLGPNARIEGAVRGSAGDQPEIASSAQHGALELSIHTQDDKPEPAFNAVSTLLAAVYSALACLVTAAAAEWLARKHTANAAQLAKTRTGYLIASGIIGAIAAPVAVIILCCLVITLPLAGAATFALIALTIVSGGFTAAALGKLVFKNLGRFPAAIAMGAILGAACALPYVGKPIAAACFMFALGYSIQNAFLGLTNRNEGAPTPQTGNPVSAATAPAAAPQQPAAAAPDAPQNGSGNPPQAPTA
ncbi:MAG: polymer-forming cytoskeletal protein [Senegalimassilia anaerobia]|uniref:polymer-forming cytoskeletal protein n=1 Tax=Senegalimassilia anaerobia TaxID=1473216 RepID=UPI002E766734|nr:polymer-forming cytoskeletal protein [Senegalimassilia anaerobia]MEE0303721.1 polymer-forming cytoskeletal protein [Senegalimassilia anaerobia]